MDDLNPIRAGWIGVLGGAGLWRQAPQALYVEELLAQAGVLNWRWLNSIDELADPEIRLALVPNARALSEVEARAVVRFCDRGGRLLALGRPGPLAELFAAAPQPPVREGWLVRADAAAGRFATTCPTPLHVFDLTHLLPAGDGANFRPGPINFCVGSPNVNWPISARAVVGHGEAMLIAADLVGSIVRMQQGLAIHRDGTPAPDGSAPIDDGILKCDDSIMLDWTRDRQKVEPELPPIFLQPQADLLRELLIAALLQLAESASLAVVLLDHWPRGLPAVGLLSHDSDNNRIEEMERQLEIDRQADVRATWCVMSGTDDGAVSELAPEQLARLAASGHEIALHYDAQTDHPNCRWGGETLAEQLVRLRNRMRTVGIDSPIYSNKNHYARWQGRLEFFHWLASHGIRVDQSKGPSKPGCVGWAFGTCHPWRPIDDETSPPRLLDLLEIGFATGDLGLDDKYPAAFGRPIIDAAVGRRGVAHLLFHPAHCHRDNVRQNLIDHVAYGRARGLEWWTSRRIGRWQFARRAVTLRRFELREGQAVLTLSVRTPLESPTLLVDGGGRGRCMPGDVSGDIELMLPLRL